MKDLGITTFTYTRSQLERLALYLSLEGEFACAVKSAMQDDLLWPELDPAERAFHICWQLAKIEANGGKVDWPEPSEFVTQYVR
jgi:hypothetical protein